MNVSANFNKRFSAGGKHALLLRLEFYGAIIYL